MCSDLNAKALVDVDMIYTTKTGTSLKVQKKGLHDALTPISAAKDGVLKKNDRE